MGKEKHKQNSYSKKESESDLGVRLMFSHMILREPDSTCLLYVLVIPWRLCKNICMQYYKMLIHMYIL